MFAGLSKQQGDGAVTEAKRNRAMKWAPLLLMAAALVALLAALAVRGGSSIWLLTLFVVLLPAALASTLIAWWPRRGEAPEGIDWRRNATLGGAGLLLAAVVTLMLGVAWTGGRLGNMLLVAGALLLPPASLVAALGWLLGRHGTLEQQLETDEVIGYRGREHWGVFVPVALVVVLAAFAALGPFSALGYSAAAVLYLLVLPGVGVNALSAYLNTEFAVTGKRLLFAHGLIRRKVESLPLTELAACGVNRNLFGRLLGYGKVTVICDNGRTLAVRGVRDPEALRERIQAARG